VIILTSPSLPKLVHQSRKIFLFAGCIIRNGILVGLCSLVGY
jgi:hypothetical protein